MNMLGWQKFLYICFVKNRLELTGGENATAPTRVVGGSCPQGGDNCHHHVRAADGQPK